MTEHLDRRTFEQEGWFAKVGNQPIKDYHKSCNTGGRGYLGPRSEAHHIIPQESIDNSVAETPESWRYIGDVMYITPWNINHADNMVGLPTAHSYMQYYQGKTKLSGAGMQARGKALVAWFNTYSLDTRRDWLEDFGNHNPENHPIHNPTCFGHKVYSAEVQQELLQQVWNELDEAAGDHETDAENVSEALNEVAEMNYDYLIDRGEGATESNWNKAHSSPTNTAALKPFTMADVSANPIFG